MGSTTGTKPVLFRLWTDFQPRATVGTATQPRGQCPPPRPAIAPTVALTTMMTTGRGYTSQAKTHPINIASLSVRGPGNPMIGVALVRIVIKNPTCTDRGRNKSHWAVHQQRTRLITMVQIPMLQIMKNTSKRFWPKPVSGLNTPVPQGKSITTTAEPRFHSGRNQESGLKERNSRELSELRKDPLPKIHLDQLKVEMQHLQKLMLTTSIPMSWPEKNQRRPLYCSNNSKPIDFRNDPPVRPRRDPHPNPKARRGRQPPAPAHLPGATPQAPAAAVAAIVARNGLCSLTKHLIGMKGCARNGTGDSKTASTGSIENSLVIMIKHAVGALQALCNLVALLAPVAVLVDFPWPRTFMVDLNLLSPTKGVIKTAQHPQSHPE